MCDQAPAVSEVIS